MGNTLRVQSHLCGGWGGKTAWPWETWGRSAWGRQAEGLLRNWNMGEDVSSCFKDLPQRLLGPVSERTADVASIDQFPARPCGLWNWLAD